MELTLPVVTSDSALVLERFLLRDDATSATAAGNPENRRFSLRLYCSSSLIYESCLIILLTNVLLEASRIV